MQIHQVKPKTRLKTKKRVGRGGKKGTYSGRGVKGQKARAGHKLAPAIRGIIKKYHKLRGYRFNPVPGKYAIVNLSDLENNFESKNIISPETLTEKGIVRKLERKIPPIKILGNGMLKKDFIITGCLLSKTAIEKIEKVGGKITLEKSIKSKPRLKPKLRAKIKARVKTETEIKAKAKVEKN
ncbi:MAG: uL15 family ribosomal protein [Candidatus Pacebacteria bacterium]|nr:uL15 family ribosomal protein [Candidatus Paceibacterota bacterium]